MQLVDNYAHAYMVVFVFRRYYFFDFKLAVALVFIVFVLQFMSYIT